MVPEGLFFDQYFLFEIDFNDCNHTIIFMEDLNGPVGQSCYLLSFAAVNNRTNSS